MQQRNIQRHETGGGENARLDDYRHLRERRRNSDEFYEATHDAIDQALSSDSALFLTSFEQTGGQ